jgi:hypothetical protein
MKRITIPALLTIVLASAGALAQGNGNSSSGGLPALIARVEALEAQLNQITSNDISDTQYVFTGHITRFTDVINPNFTFFDNVIRIQYTSVLYTFHADGTGTYELTECVNSGLYSNFAADDNSDSSSYMNFIEGLCGPSNLSLTWQQNDNFIFIALDNGIEFDAVISTDGSLISATNVDGGIVEPPPGEEAVYESHALSGFTGVKVN